MAPDEGIVPLITMKSMLPFITAGGSVFRAQVLGRFEWGGPPPGWKSCSMLANPPPRYYPGKI